MNLEGKLIFRVPVVELDLQAVIITGENDPPALTPPAPPARQVGERGSPHQGLTIDRRGKGGQDLGHLPEPPLGMAVDDGELSRIEFRTDDLPEIVGDDARIQGARFKEQSFADRVNRDLKDPRESIPLPGIEWKVVVSELKLGRIEIAELFELVVEARDAQRPCGAANATGSNPELPEDPKSARSRLARLAAGSRYTWWKCPCDWVSSRRRSERTDG